MAACQARRFDLVLMDCQMPEMDGWQATRRLRAAGHEMPIIALTASALAGDRDRCLMVGMNDYLTKPIESALLAEKIDRWLRESGALPDEAPPSAFDPAVIGERFFGGLHRGGKFGVGQPAVDGRPVYSRQPGGGRNGRALSVGFEEPPLAFVPTRRISFF